MVCIDTVYLKNAVHYPKNAKTIVLWCYWLWNSHRLISIQELGLGCTQARALGVFEVLWELNLLRDVFSCNRPMHP